MGGHNERANIDVVRAILHELKKPESSHHLCDRSSRHDRRYAIDPTKIHNELAGCPRPPFEDGIRRTIRWYLDNRPWWGAHSGRGVSGLL